MADYRFSLKEKIGQLFMFGFRGTEVTDDIKRFIETNNPGFIILFARNIETLPQVKELTRDIHALGKIPPFIYTDQEGGTVVQFKELAATVVSPMGLSAGGAPRNARKAGRIIGAEMKALGVDGVLAPSLDVNYEENNPIIGIRSFSDDPETVAKYALEFAAGLNEKGVACCGKHYPGHGGSTADSHLEIPEVAVSPEYFSYYCYLPFFTAAQAGIDAIMTGHLLFPALSPHIATFCPYFIRHLLREIAGYNGVVMSDCLEMKAVREHFSPADMVKNAMDAGIDMMIASHSPDFQAELLDALYSQVKNGAIPEKRIDESLERILKLKEKYPPLPTTSPEGTKKTVRIHRAAEKKIADRSITVLRNRKAIIPIKPGARPLIIEWGKVQATMPPSSATKVSYLARVAGQFLEHVDIEILDLPLAVNDEHGSPLSHIPETLRNKLKDYDHIIAALYSRSPEIERLQAELVKELLGLRSDLIVVALGNPYDIRNFPLVDTYVVTYGFREVQLEALFRVLTGVIKPTGQLPVQIHNIFPRWS
jgi:beta-N-acetylhexosaminidase